MRVWFNRTFSNLHSVLEAIRRGDAASEFELVCSHDHPRFPGFLAAHEHFLEPSGLRGADYVDFCLDFCERSHIAVFAPGREAVALAEQTARFASLDVRVLNAASAENLRALHDKARFYASAFEFSIPPPEFDAFDSAEAFDAAYERLRARHPALCVKPAQGVFGVGFRVIDEGRRGLDLILKGLMHHIPLPDLRRLLAEAQSFPTLLLMEYLGGQEYSADCVGDGARLIACVQRCKPVDGRYGQNIVDLPEIRLACMELTRRYGLFGLFNIQFREGRHGLRLLEVNPRFSGGVGMSCAAGINLPYLALRGAVQGFAGPLAAPPVALGARVVEIPLALCLDAAAS
ncbi:MAG: ATP-grasp domain-containing protein [Methylococcaceae bacterium]|nr:ATP-grasp domain-containing protein [Methylococcaceae bacterium]